MIDTDKFCARLVEEHEDVSGSEEVETSGWSTCDWCEIPVLITHIAIDNHGMVFDLCEDCYYRFIRWGGT